MGPLYEPTGPGPMGALHGDAVALLLLAFALVSLGVALLSFGVKLLFDYAGPRTQAAMRQIASWAVAEASKSKTPLVFL